MRMKHLAELALLVGLAVAAGGVAAQQWKWRDANGRVTVSDLPPPREVADKDILQRPTVPSAKPRAAEATAAAGASAPAASAAAAAPAPKPADKELEAKKRAAEAERAAKAKAEADKLAAQRTENCQRAREHIATIESGVRMTRTNAKGEREFLDDAQRAAELRRTREIAQSECR